MSTVETCVDCTDDADHCHAVWIHHADGHQECLAVDCRTGADAHLFVLACVEIDPTCCG